MGSYVPLLVPFQNALYGIVSHSWPFVGSYSLSCSTVQRVRPRTATSDESPVIRSSPRATMCRVVDPALWQAVSSCCPRHTIRRPQRIACTRRGLPHCTDMVSTRSLCTIKSNRMLVNYRQNVTCREDVLEMFVRATFVVSALGIRKMEHGAVSQR